MFGIVQCIVGLIFIGIVFLFLVIGTIIYFSISLIKFIREIGKTVLGLDEYNKNI